MSATRFSVTRLLAGVCVLALVAGVVGITASMEEADLSVASDDGRAAPSSATVAHGDASPADLDAEGVVPPTERVEPPSASPPAENTSGATPPALPPLEPPAEPDPDPLVVLNADPAASGITDYHSLGVPTPADHGGPGSYSVGTGCASPCIDSGVATPLGIGAHVEVATDTPARVWIVVWNESLGHHFMVDSGPGGEVTSFGADFTELDAGTTYQAMAVAQDANGYADHVYGEFETLRRHVRFGLSNVDITNQPSDTEAFPTTKWADGEHHPGGWETPFPTIENVGDSVEVVLRLTAILPCDGLCQAVGDNSEIPSTNSGSGHRSAWVLLSLWDLPSQDRLAIDLEGTPALVETPTSRTFVVTLANGPDGGALPGDYGGPLSARVDVTVWVTYS